MKTIEGYNVKIYTDNIEGQCQRTNQGVTVHRCVQQV